MENHHKEVKFISQSILYSVIRGIVVGTGVGVVVVAFRLAIQKLFEMVTYLYHQAHHQPFYLLVIILFYVFIVVFVGKMIAGAPDAKGSGIPQVEAELKGMMQLQWWTVLWRKFIGGSLAI
ncbi:MAG: chloride channel protein, partial [Streptococcus minor]|nr:chloride channel protein [Streptococcus minor]